MWELSNSLKAEDKTIPEALKLVQEYNRLYPASGFGLAQQAGLHLKLKQFSEARVAIERAIAVAGEELDYYKTRADAERGLKIDEHQVLDRLAAGYRQAGDILKRRGDEEGAAKAYAMRWKTLSDAALGTQDATIVLPGGKEFAATMGNQKGRHEHLQCDAKITVCEKTEVTSAYGAPIVAAILSLQSGTGKTRIVRIDRGSDDGLVSGATGELFSTFRKDTRDFDQIGRSEVLSTELRAAFVLVTMDDPTGTGLVQVGDTVQFWVRVPKLENRSELWRMSRFHITFMDMNREKSFFDYRTLYADEKPEVVAEIMDKMIADIRESGRKFDQVLEGKPLPKGKFAGKTMRQALESTTEADLEQFLKYVGKYPGRYVGNIWNITETYAFWVLNGTSE